MTDDKTPKEKDMAVNLPVRDDGTITLPDELRENLHLHPGDEIRIVPGDDGRGEFIVIPHDQRGFWTEERLAGEREADEDLKNGRFTRFYDDESFFAYLENPDAE